MKCKSDPSFLQLLIEKSQTDGKNEKKKQKNKEMKKKPRMIINFYSRMEKNKIFEKIDIFAKHSP